MLCLVVVAVVCRTDYFEETLKMRNLLEELRIVRGAQAHHSGRQGAYLHGEVGSGQRGMRHHTLARAGGAIESPALLQIPQVSHLAHIQECSKYSTQSAVSLALHPAGTAP